MEGPEPSYASHRAYRDLLGRGHFLDLEGGSLVLSQRTAGGEPLAEMATAILVVCKTVKATGEPLVEMGLVERRLC